jgi:hypothetical protein
MADATLDKSMQAGNRKPLEHLPEFPSSTPSTPSLASSESLYSTPSMHIPSTPLLSPPIIEATPMVSPESHSQVDLNSKNSADIDLEAGRGISNNKKRRALGKSSLLLAVTTKVAFMLGPLTPNGTSAMSGFFKPTSPKHDSCSSKGSFDWGEESFHCCDAGTQFTSKPTWTMRESSVCGEEAGNSISLSGSSAVKDRKRVIDIYDVILGRMKDTAHEVVLEKSDLIRYSAKTSSPDPGFINSRILPTGGWQLGCAQAFSVSNLIDPSTNLPDFRVPVSTRIPRMASTTPFLGITSPPTTSCATLVPLVDSISSLPPMPPSRIFKKSQHSILALTSIRKTTITKPLSPPCIDNTISSELAYLSAEVCSTSSSKPPRLFRGGFLAFLEIAHIDFGFGIVEFGVNEIDETDIGE